MAKFIVTGGAGFIGSNYLKMMVTKYPDDCFLCIDKLTYASNIKYIGHLFSYKNFEFKQIDICDEHELDNVFDCFRPDYVINFAAESHVDNSIMNSSDFIKTNIMGVQVLLDLCKKYGVKKFHQVSTDEVYGDVAIGSSQSFDESSPLKPSNPYSASKASADLLVLSYFRTFKLPITISRCSNNYGPNQCGEKFIPVIINNALENRKIPIYGDGRNLRDWIYVEDHCKAIDLIVRSDYVGEIFNICANNEISNIDMADMILDKMDLSRDLLSYVNDRPGHDVRYSISCKKIKELLKWNPTEDFNVCLTDTIEWYKSNKT